jgi:hypothetical protein
MTPESEPKYLPGLRLYSLPSSKIAAVMSQAVVPSVEPVEAVVAEAVPVVAETVAESTETPVVQSVVVQEEEEEQMDFDMEWD